MIQECARPERQATRCVWFGDNPKQGILVRVANPFQVHALPVRDGVPNFVVPAAVTGPVSFTMFCVWAKGKQPYSYVAGVVKAVHLYRDMIAASPTVLIGDFNSNARWDPEHIPEFNHSTLVELLAELNIVSAYHKFFAERHGHETKPTYYFHDVALCES